MANRGVFSSAQATMFGRATSRFNFTFGGVTIVYERLSASGGTEMMGWGASSGSAFFGWSVAFCRVSRGGRYSSALEYTTCEWSNFATVTTPGGSAISWEIAISKAQAMA